MKDFRKSILSLITETSTNLPPDVRRAIKSAMEIEDKGTRASLALDTIETPFGSVKDAVGGSAVYISSAASYFASPVRIVGVVGGDFPREALDYLREYWIPISRNGTFAEHFGSDYNTSYCHGWGAGPVMQLPAYVLGVRPVAPGWKEVEIAPQTAGLEWAEGTVPTPMGDISVKWRVVGGKPKLEYAVPAGVKVVKASLR